MANGTVRFNKEGIVVADIVFGMGLITDSRGSQEQFNASHLPYSGSESVAAALGNRYTKDEIDIIAGLYARINGNSAEVFNVATGTDATHAVNKSQMEALFALGVTAAEVLLVDGSSDPLVPTMDNQPSTKKYVDDTVIAIGAGDMAKGIYDNNNNGIVDSTDAVGDPAALPLGKTPANQIMRLAQEQIIDCDLIVDMGVYIGENVANAPASGWVLIEQYLLGNTKVQRCFAVDTGLETTRRFDATWELWEVSDGSNRLRKAGGVLHGDLVIGNGTTGTRLAIRASSTETARIELQRQDATLDIGIASVAGVLTLTQYDTDGVAVLGTVTIADGNIAVSAVAPTSAGHLTRKDYVDTAITDLTDATELALADLSANKVTRGALDDYSGSLDDFIVDGIYAVSFKYSSMVPSLSSAGVVEVNTVVDEGVTHILQKWSTDDEIFTRRKQDTIWTNFRAAMITYNESNLELQAVRGVVSCTQTAYDNLAFPLQGVLYLIQDTIGGAITMELTQPLLCNRDENFVGTTVDGLDTAEYPLLIGVDDGDNEADPVYFTIAEPSCKLTYCLFDMSVNTASGTSYVRVTFEDDTEVEFLDGSANNWAGEVIFENGVLTFNGTEYATGKVAIKELRAHAGDAEGESTLTIQEYNFEVR